MQTMSKSRYAKTLVAFHAKMSVNIGRIFTKIGAYIDGYAFKILCSYCDVSFVINAVVKSLKCVTITILPSVLTNCE